MFHFEKVPYEQFKEDCGELGWDDTVLTEIYNNIKLPQRATQGSAGYDFFSPFDLELNSQWIVVPTGIRWVCDTNCVLLLAPRSGLGFKSGMRLRNTIGVIDKDYADAANHGHIMAKVAAESECSVNAGKGFIQGIVVPFAVADDENAEKLETRIGGFGSTTR